MGQSVNIVDFVILDMDQQRQASEPLFKAVQAVTGYKNTNPFKGSIDLVGFADGCHRRRHLDIKRTLPKYKNIVQHTPALVIPAQEKEKASASAQYTSPPEQRELVTVAEPGCQVCNVTPISLVKNTTSCNRCTVDGPTCKDVQAAKKIPKKEDFTQVTLIKGRLTISCSLAEGADECVPKTLVESVLQRMLNHPQTGAALVVSTDVVMKSLFNKGEVTAPLSEEEKNGTDCSHKTTYRVYGTASFDQQASELVGLLSAVGTGEPAVVQRFLTMLNETDQGVSKVCRVWMSQEVTSRTESLDTERKSDPNAVHPPGMGGSGRRLLEEGVPEAPKVEVTVHECPDHTAVSEIRQEEKVHLWLEGFDLGADIVIQLMSHDGEKEIPGKVLKVFPELFKALAPVKWTGSFDFSDTPPGKYYFKVFHSDRPTYHYTYSDAFHIMPSEA